MGCACLRFDCIGEGKKKKKKKKPKKKAAKTEQQSEPPRVGLSKLFPDGNYPEGELHEYKDEYVINLCLDFCIALIVMLLVAMHGGQQMKRSDTLNV